MTRACRGSVAGLGPPASVARRESMLIGDPQVDLDLGRLLRASWDPRMGPDRERSGVLRIGRALRDLVQENEVLAVAIVEGGDITIN